MDMLGQIKESLAGSLQGDTAAISPQRCISLYLERLGCISEASARRLEVRSGPSAPLRRRPFACLHPCCLLGELLSLSLFHNSV